MSQREKEEIMEFDVILILDTIAALNLMIEGLIEILTCPLYHESQCVAAMMTA